MIRKTILSVLGAALGWISLSAQTSYWVTPPAYAEAEPASSQWIRVNKADAWGIMDMSGKEVVPCMYGRITEFNEGYCLLLQGEKLRGIFSSEGKYRTFKDDMFVDLSCPYFSEGLLAVRDVSSSWTYMTPEGEFPIRMLFQYAAPFSHGLASVREKNGEGSFLHIDKKGRVSILSSDYQDNYLVFASSFTDLNGQAGALVVDGHSQVSLRSLNGNKLADFGQMKSYDKENQVLTTKGYEIVLSAGRFIQSRRRLSDGDVKVYKTEVISRYSPLPVPILTCVRDGNLWGLDFHGKVLLEPQFASVQVLSGGRILARQDGMVGLLGIDENGQAPYFQLDKRAIVVRHPADLALSGMLILPASVPFKDVQVKVKESSGVSQVFTLDKTAFTLPVIHLVKDQALDLQVIVSACGLTYPPVPMKVPVEYRSAFTCVVPSQVTLQEGNEKAVLSLQIRNDADVPTSSCDILVDGRFIKTQERIGAREQVSIPLSFSVNLEDLDSISREIKVEIREKDVPAYVTRKHVTFNRNFN